MSKPSTYLDHSATTATDPRVLEAMLPYFGERYGNPSSLYQAGATVRQALDEARRRIAEVLGARPKEIFFTSCGTESDNMAIRGAVWAQRDARNHIITSQVEHHAVSHTCKQLEEVFGCEVTYLPVDREGLVDPDAVGRAITERTALISIMYANNEVGTVEPINKIAKIARQHQIPFHTDAVQAPGLLPLNVDTLGVDLMAISGHKFYAPKGVGVLYVRTGTKLVPTQTGGGQERGMRAGTENTALIIGLARALELAESARPAEVLRLTALRDDLIQGVLNSIPDAVLTGSTTERLASHTSFLFNGVEGEGVVLKLDMAGIAASSGSACSSGDEGPSPVLAALGYTYPLSRGSLRLSLGRENTPEDVEHVLRELPPIIASLRALSPYYNSDGTVALSAPAW
ncbi:MAG: aminotransferase class V-fold PLP-dependent enzyme [Chloroflexi bacterium]|nr:aminotransferase class V-fold PLP-dependent enzyme [Chloroflexota bacterium]